VGRIAIVITELRTAAWTNVERSAVELVVRWLFQFGKSANRAISVQNNRLVYHNRRVGKPYILNIARAMSAPDPKRTFRSIQIGLCLPGVRVGAIAGKSPQRGLRAMDALVFGRFRFIRFARIVFREPAHDIVSLGDQA